MEMHEQQIFFHTSQWPMLEQQAVHASRKKGAAKQAPQSGLACTRRVGKGLARAFMHKLPIYPLVLSPVEEAGARG
jgi:hypothetical protein